MLGFADANQRATQCIQEDDSVVCKASKLCMSIGKES